MATARRLSGASLCAWRGGSADRGGRARGEAATARARRVPKDPAKYGKDYDAIRAALQEESSGWFSFSRVLNFVSESGAFMLLRGLKGGDRVRAAKPPSPASPLALELAELHGIDMRAARVAAAAAPPDIDAAFVAAELRSVKAALLCDWSGLARLVDKAPVLLFEMGAAERMRRLVLLKQLVPSADAARLAADAPALLVDGAALARAAEAVAVLRDGLPGVRVDPVLQVDPTLLLLSPESLRASLASLHELWTPEQVALSDVDNDFFAEELALALRTLALQPPSGA